MLKMVKAIPYLVVPKAKEAIELYKKVFDAKVVSHEPFSKEMGEQMGFPDNFDYVNSTMHAELDIFGSDIYVSDSDSPEKIPKGNVEVVLSVDNLEQIETFYNNAKKSGVEIIMELQKTFWGAHFTRFRDSFGVGWQLNYAEPQESPKEEKPKKTKKSSKTTKKSTPKSKKKVPTKSTKSKSKTKKKK
jgi:PhnB protein